jgi:ribonuclease VapC
VIAVDTSGLMAILLGEKLGNACLEVLAREPDLVMSAVTLSEAFIVARSRGVARELADLLEATPVLAVPADAATAARVDEIYLRWGKTHHAAALNIVDCFSYDVAQQLDCPLLFVGNDFARTDIVPVLV